MGRHDRKRWENQQEQAFGVYPIRKRPEDVLPVASAYNQAEAEAEQSPRFGGQSLRNCSLESWHGRTRLFRWFSELDSALTRKGKGIWAVGKQAATFFPSDPLVG